MRKYIIPLFLSLCPTIAPAITNAECQQLDSIQQCKKRGCGWYASQNFDQDSGCFACTAGTYQNLQNCNVNASLSPCDCERCPSAPMTQDDCLYWGPLNSDTGLEQITQCEFYIKCNAGFELKTDNNHYTCTACSLKNNTANNRYYFNDKDTSIKYTYNGSTYDISSSSTPTCKKCGAHSKPKDQGTKCQCDDGYHTEGSTNSDINNNTKDCVINQYTITLHHTKNHSEKILKNHGETIQLTRDTNYETTGHDFNGWASDADATTPEHSDGTTLTVTADAEWYAIWIPKKFIVTYENDENTTKKQECTYGETCLARTATCNNGENICKGKYFQHWDCASGCSGQIYPNDDISTISAGNTMTLTAIWKTCDAGYYCNGGTQNACPAGCTSDADSDEITDCYLSGETQFCHGDACFTIPDLKIPYSSK